MALKTFNVDAKIYSEFSKHCKKQGVSMSKKIENFIRDEVEKIKNPVSEDKGEIILPVKKENFDLHPLKKYC